MKKIKMKKSVDTKLVEILEDVSIPGIPMFKKQSAPIRVSDKIAHILCSRGYAKETEATTKDEKKVKDKKAAKAKKERLKETLEETVEGTVEDLQNL